MGFHDVRLPETFSEGSEFGPGFATKIIALDSGAEHRIQRGAVAGRRTYSLTRGIANLTDLKTLQDFFIARGGAANSFRVKDWLDYATTPTGTIHREGDAAVTHADFDLVLVSGLVYQAVKRYVSGSQTIVRTLTKLVSGTVKVGDASGELMSGWSVNLVTGRITFSGSPSGTPTFGAQFDVPCRFDEETDRALMVAIAAVDSGDLPEIRCVEDVEPTVASQDFPFGGFKDHGVITANVSVSELEGKFQRAAPTTTGKKFILPDYADLALGGPYFVLHNDGSQAMEIENHLGVDVVNPLAVGAMRVIWLAQNASGTKTWYATS